MDNLTLHSHLCDFSVSGCNLCVSSSFSFSFISDEGVLIDCFVFLYFSLMIVFLFSLFVNNKGE